MRRTSAEVQSMRTLANAHEAVQSAARAVQIAAEAVKVCSEAMNPKRADKVGFEVQADGAANG